MKVSDLIALLAKCPQDSTVILSKDREGNDYRVLCDHTVGPAVLTREPTHGYVRDIELIDESELCEQGCDGSGHEPEPCDKAPEDAQAVVVLWPTH